jgi:membrane associated rhomboid family serine protease
LESESPPEVLPEPQPVAAREPLLTLPGALTAYILLLAAIHLRVLLPPDLENWTIDVFGFIPKRYDSNLLADGFPGGEGAKLWTFVTYSLLHANLTHIGFNVLWLLPFGSALVRRFGAVRFFGFMAVTAAAGALAHLASHEHDLAPMIGASASVSGTMAAAIRFAFVRGSFLSFSRGDADAAARVPAQSLWRADRSRSARMARASPGRPISAASSPGFCCSRCSILFRARHRRMLRMRPRKIRFDLSQGQV